jgi:hypothetical protein
MHGTRTCRTREDQGQVKGWSKTVISRNIEENAMFHARSHEVKTPQAKAHCSVSKGKSEIAW